MAANSALGAPLSRHSLACLLPRLDEYVHCLSALWLPASSTPPSLKSPTAATKVGGPKTFLGGPKNWWNKKPSSLKSREGQICATVERLKNDSEYGNNFWYRYITGWNTNHIRHGTIFIQIFQWRRCIRTPIFSLNIFESVIPDKLSSTSPQLRRSMGLGLEASLVKI